MLFPTTRRDGQLRPLVPVIVNADCGQRAMLDALVDSGADVTLFPQTVAEQLLIDTSLLPRHVVRAAVGGSSEYRICEVVLEIRRKPDVFRWKTAIGFVDRPMSYAILGTRGFFEFFRFDYVAGEHSFEISPSTVLPS